MAVDVEVVVGRLLHAPQRLELGKHPGGDAELVHQLEPAQRVGTGEDAAQLRELTLARRLARPRRLAAGQRDRRLVGREAELGA